MTRKTKDGIVVYNPEDFEKMRRAGKLAAEVLDYITDYVDVGVTTGELDDLCRKYIESHGAVPACLGYHGYPKSTCISINHVICHGIPDDRKLADGDILNIDVTVILDGWFGDTSRMYYAGKPKLKATRLCDVTYECMMRGIGHGLGRVFHDSPNVMHCGRKGTGPVMEEGMFFTIEPMINIGRKDGFIMSNGWTAVTRDKSLSAQFEHSLGVTKDGYEVFTYSPKGLDKPPYK